MSHASLAIILPLVIYNAFVLPARACAKNCSSTARGVTRGDAATAAGASGVYNNPGHFRRAPARRDSERGSLPVKHRAAKRRKYCHGGAL